MKKDLKDNQMNRSQLKQRGQQAYHEFEQEEEKKIVSLSKLQFRKIQYDALRFRKK